MLRSDGAVLECGPCGGAQLHIPALKTWKELLTLQTATLTYVENKKECGQEAHTLLLQAVCIGTVIKLLRMSGETACEIEANAVESLADFQLLLAEALAMPCKSFDVIFPLGEMLNETLRSQPHAMLTSFCQ